MPLNNENNNDCCKCTTPQYELTLNQQGPQGKTGPQGLPGFSPTIVVNTNTDKVYSLTINTIDGQIVTPNLKASVPGDGPAGYVLTKNTSTPYDMSFQAIPQATETQSGILQLATITDTQPDEEGEVDDTKAVTPDLLVEYTNQEINNADSKYVTLDTSQTITGLKTFSNDTGILTNSIKEIENGSTIITYNTDASNIFIGSTGNNTTDITLRTSSNGTLKYAKGPNDTYNIITSNDIATTTTPGIVKPDGTTITVDADGTIHSVGGTGSTEDYTELTNKPQINGVELTGNKTGTDLGLASSNELNQLASTVTGLETSKQDTITDLSTIRNGASLGATALQPGANISDLTNDSNYLVNNFSNLSSEGLDKLNQSKALTTGNVSSDADVYADIQKYAHSTFDLSKFEVIGSPVITEDGIASGFSANNCIYTNAFLNFSNFNAWELTFKVYVTNSTNRQTLFWLRPEYNSNLNTNQSYLNQDKTIMWNLYKTPSDGVTGRMFSYTTNFTLTENSTYFLKYKFTGTQYLIGYSTDNENYIWETVHTSTTRCGASGYVQFGLKYNTYAFLGSIDLKSIAVWADGVPVFNGNKTGTDTINDIEIPYTLSKTGSKIVDAAYRDRVQDLYEQTGEALFYTIDEENQDFTLPAGDIYGMITKTNEETSYTLPPATTTTLGGVKPDGSTITVTSDGTISANTTIPSNVVTTNDSTPLVIWRGTQTEYDGITTKDANTLYIITGA